MEWVNCIAIFTCYKFHQIANLYQEFLPFYNLFFDSLGNFVSNVPVVSKPFLWHLRLGDVSDNKLNTLHNHILDVIQFQSNKDCVLYPIAKQKKLHFPSFNHISSNAFDIVHCDVWGPFVKPTQEGFKFSHFS